jgi:hypothetical protein
VDPEDVVLLGLLERATQLDLEARGVRGVDDVAAGEGAAHRALDDGVQLLLAVVLVGAQGQVEGQPDVPLIALPVSEEAPPPVVDVAQEPLEDCQRGLAPIGIERGNAPTPARRRRARGR